MSPFFKVKDLIPLGELARWWRVPGHTEEDVILAIVDAAFDDKLVLRSYFEGLGLGVVLDPEVLRTSLTNQLQSSPYSSVRAEKLRLGSYLAIHREEVQALAQHCGLLLPEGLEAEPLSMPAPGPSDHAAVERLMKDFMAEHRKLHGKTASRDLLRKFARDRGFPQTWADQLKREHFPGAKGRPRNDPRPAE